MNGIATQAPCRGGFETRPYDFASFAVDNLFLPSLRFRFHLVRHQLARQLAHVRQILKPVHQLNDALHFLLG